MESNGYLSRPHALRQKNARLSALDVRRNTSHCESSTRIPLSSELRSRSHECASTSRPEESQGKIMSPWKADCNSQARMNLIPKWLDNFHFGIKSLPVTPTYRQPSRKTRRPNGIKCISVTTPLVRPKKNDTFPARPRRSPRSPSRCSEPDARCPIPTSGAAMRPKRKHPGCRPSAHKWRPSRSGSAVESC